MAETTHQVLLRTAAELIGRQDLALRLKVPLALLEAWIAGHGTMPERTLSLLVNLLAKPRST